MAALDINGLSLHALAARVSDPFWRDRLNDWIAAGKSSGIHLAVFSQPFLEYVLKGTKTIDSRFSANRIAPYQHVFTGDIILIKQTGGPVVGICGVGQAWFYELEPDTLKNIKQQFGKHICADEEFWRSRRKRSFGTLILLKDVRPITPLPIDKRDRRGWVTVKKNKIDKPIVIAFAGPIGSGKTTISRALAKKLHSKHASFGDHFRAMASRLGHNPSERAVLQRLGEEQVGLSPESVCRELLNAYEWKPTDGTIVIDGVRHLEILSALTNAVAPLDVFLVYVQRDNMRSTLLSTKVGKQNMELFDAHSTELQNNILRSAADIVVSAEHEPALIIDRVARQLEEPRNNDHARSRNRSSL
jgi:shikimate kinase